MGKRAFSACCALAALLVIGSGSLRANEQLTINNAGSNTMGGVYVGPYNFTLSINGQNSSVHLICDDAMDDVHPPGEYWDVTTENFSNLPSSLDGALFPKGNVNTPNVIGYQEVGFLAEQLLANLSNTTEVGEIQWAIWDIFDSPPAYYISDNDPYGTLTNQEKCDIDGNAAACTAVSGNPASSWISKAEANYASGNYSNLVIYTPEAGTQACPNYSGPCGPPQEYIGTAAEPSTLVLLGIVLLGGLGLGRRWQVA